MKCGGLTSRLISIATCLESSSKLSQGTAGTRPQDPDSVTSSSYYEERLPAQMGRLAARLGAEEKFDAIIVDEEGADQAWMPGHRGQRVDRAAAAADQVPAPTHSLNPDVARSLATKPWT